MKDNNKRPPAELLKLSTLFADLENEDLNLLSRYCETREYAAGSVVLKEQPVAGCVYIIDSGDVVVFRSENNRDAVVARFISNECFGELDLFAGSKNAVTIRSEADTRLMLFPREGLNALEIFEELPAVGSIVLKNLLSIVAKRIRSTNNLISQRSPWVQELRKLVFIDKLTGLYNLTWLTEELESELEDKPAGTAILVIKPDNFKSINDTYGHDAGDRTLALLADTVGETSEHQGTAARHGGDVFAIVFKNANARQARWFAKSVLKAIRNIDLEAKIGASGVVLTASIGIMTRKPGETVPITEIIQGAFDRMLRARNNGGDRILDTGGDDV